MLLVSQWYVLNAQQHCALLHSYELAEADGAADSRMYAREAAAAIIWGGLIVIMIGVVELLVFWFWFWRCFCFCFCFWWLTWTWCWCWCSTSRWNLWCFSNFENVWVDEMVPSVKIVLKQCDYYVLPNIPNISVIISPNIFFHSIFSLLREELRAE